MSSATRPGEHEDAILHYSHPCWISPRSASLFYVVVGIDIPRNPDHVSDSAFFAHPFNGSLPGAIGMYGLSLGVQQIGETLPNIVYALLSGLNASTVGIIALAGVQVPPPSEYKAQKLTFCSWQRKRSKILLLGFL